VKGLSGILLLHYRIYQWGYGQPPGRAPQRHKAEIAMPCRVGTRMTARDGCQ
jgi:hypothetical protein